MRKLSFALITLFCAGMLQSCQTMAGFGNDLSHFGSGVSNTASGKTWDGKNLQPRVHVPVPAPR